MNKRVSMYMYMHIRVLHDIRELIYKLFVLQPNILYIKEKIKQKFQKITKYDLSKLSISKT